jgi:WD40 repeat protein
MRRCPGRDRFELFLAERLDDRSREELERHVDRCSKCQQVLDGLTEGTDWGRLRRPANVAGVNSEIEGFLLRLQQSPPRPVKPNATREDPQGGALGDCRSSPSRGPASVRTGPGVEIAPSQPRPFEAATTLDTAPSPVPDFATTTQVATAGVDTSPAVTPQASIEGAMAAADELTSRPPPAIPGYEILGELGRGGMGVVYQARQVQLNRPCAIKMILAGTHAAPESVARFLAEAQAIARLQHPNIVQIHHVGEADGLPFFELEYLPGGGLDRQLDGTPWPPGRAALLVEQLARAIVEAHRLGVVHRDLKPANVLLAADGTPKITDFGLAKMLDSESALTRTELVMGSPSYMAPEQAGGQSRQAGPAADIYALGAVLYELLTGRPPFRGATAMETLEQVKGSEPVPPSRLVPKLARDIETICLRCLHKEPTRRYENASALSEDLRRFRAGEPIVARRVGRSERIWKWARRRPAIAALSGLIALVAAIGLIGMSVLYGQAVVARSIAVAQTTKALEALQSSEANLYTNRIALADRYRQAHDADRAHELLDDCPVALRDWEWRYLKRRHFEDVTVYPVHGAAAAVALSADSRYLVSVNFDQAIHVHDRATGRVRELKGISDGHSAVALSPNGQWMAVGGDRGTFGAGVIELWSTKTWSEVRSLSFGGSNPHALAFSPDSRRLVAGHDDDMVRVWDVATGTLRNLPGHRKSVRDVAFSSDGRLIASASQDTTIRIWDAETYKPWATLSHDRPVFGLAFHPRSRLLASSTGDDLDSSRGDLTLWDVDSAQVVRQTSGLAAMVRKVCFSPDGRRLATAGWDRVVRIWDATLLHELLPLTGHASLLRCLTFSQDGNQLVSAGDDGIRCWNATPLSEQLRHRPLRGLSARGQPVFALALTPDGRHLISAGEDHTPYVWDVETGRQLLAYRKHRYPITALAVRPDGQAVATAGYYWPAAPGVDDLVIRIWDPWTGADFVQLRGHRPGVSALAFHPDGVQLASASPDGTVRLWDTRTGKQLHQFPSVPGWVLSVAFTPDGNRLAAGDDRGEIHILDTANRQLLHVLRGHTQRVVALAFHPDSVHLASASLDGTVRIWHSLTPVEQRLFDGARGRGLAWSPDGQYIAMSGAHGALKVWEHSSGRRVLTLQGHTDDLTAAAFTPDGRRIVTSGWDGAIKLWDTALDDPDLWAGESRRLVGHTTGVARVAVLPDGKRAISGGDDRTIRVWDIASGRELRRWTGSDGKVVGLAVTADGTRVVVAGDDSDLRVWEIESGRQLHRLRGHGGAVFALAVTPDGRHALSGGGLRQDEGWKSGSDLDLHLWDIATGTEIHSPFSGHRGGIWSVAVSQDGRRAASASMDGTVRVWEIGTGREFRCFDGHHGHVTNVEFLPDGERLLSAGMDRHLRLWDIATGREVRRFDGLRGDVAGVAISPDGRRVVTGGNLDHNLRLWDIATGRQLYHYEVPHAWLTRGSFTRDGRQAIWASFDGALRVWDLPEQFTSAPGTR